MPQTLAELGYRMPAEWEPHEATWIAWPHHRDDWPGKFAAIPWVYAEIVRHLSQAEEVRILVDEPGRGRSGPRGLQRSAVERRTRSLSPRPHRSRLDAGFRPDLRRLGGRQLGRRQLALQRLGEVPELGARQSSHAKAMP